MYPLQIEVISYKLSYFPSMRMSVSSVLSNSVAHVGMLGNLDSQKESSPKGCLVYSLKICIFRKKVSDF